jgi:hypothetical protein
MVSHNSYFNTHIEHQRVSLEQQYRFWSIIIIIAFNLAVFQNYCHFWGFSHIVEGFRRVYYILTHIISMSLKFQDSWYNTAPGTVIVLPVVLH